MELLDRHLTGKKEIFGLQIEPLNHVFFRRVVFVAGRDGVAVHAEIGKIIEHLLDFLHVGFLVDGCVGRDLIAEQLRHFDRENAFFENAFALDNEIVNALKPIEMDVPIHPFARADSGLGRIFRALADFRRIFFREQTSGEEIRDFFFDKLRFDRQS